MATLYVSYYGNVQNGVSSQPLFVDVLTTSSTTTAGTVNTQGAVVASLFSDTAHYYAVGPSAAAAVTSGAYLPANVEKWVDLNGTNDKVAARTVA